MKIKLILGTLLLSSAALFAASHQGVVIVGGDMSCVSQDCNTPRSQVVADIDDKGVITWIADESQVKSVTYHGVDPSGTAIVSCTGGCTMNRGFFGTTVCDSEGICMEFWGKVKTSTQKQEISQ